MIRFRLITAIVLLIFAQNIFAQITAKEIIDKNLSVTGFASPENRIKTFLIKGKLIQDITAMDLQMYGVLPDKMKMVVNYQGYSFTQASNGETSWKYSITDSVYRIVENEKEKAYSFLQHWTGDLDKFKTGEITGELDGLGELDGIAVYKLKLSKNGKIRYYYIDKISHLILRIDNPAKKETTYYLNYKKVGNLLLPYKLDGYTNGKLEMSIEMDTVQINIPINEKIFDIPEKSK